MIHPLFEDERSLLIEEKAAVLSEGVARMFIINRSDYLEFHRKKLKVGTKGYFMEASKKVATLTVLEVFI